MEGGAKSDGRGCAASDVGERHECMADVARGRRMEGREQSTRVKGKRLTTAKGVMRA